MTTSEFAGLPQGELNLVVFQNESQLSAMLKSAGIPLRGRDIIGPDGHQKPCDCCGQPLRLENLGNVMPGSALFFCDDPFCLSDYIAEHSPAEPNA